MNVSIKQSPDRCLLIRKTINDIKSILLRNVFEKDMPIKSLTY